MGIFGSRTSTQVSSVAYPLGEDGENRTNTVRNAVINATMQGRPVGEALTQTLQRGGGISLKNAFRYARDKYADGLPVANTAFFDRPDMSVLTAILAPMHGGASIQYAASLTGSAEFTWWAERYLAETYGYDRTIGEFLRPPEGVDRDAALAYDYEPNGTIRILLMNAGGTSKVLSWRPVGLQRMGNYVHAAYQTVQDFHGDGSTTTRPANPGETDSVQVDSNTVELAGETQHTVVRHVTIIAGGTATVVKTTVTTVTSRPKYFIYQLGTGQYPTLDAWRWGGDLVAPYFPSIPVRVDNQDWTSSARQQTSQYKTSKELLKKVGANLDDLSKTVNTNPDVKEIDYAFIVFGVALNNKSQEGKRYLVRFFEHLRGISAITRADYNHWETTFVANPTINVTTPANNTLIIHSPRNRAQNHDIKLSWNYIETTIKTGQIFAGAKAGDCDISMSGFRLTFNLIADIIVDNSKLYARRQIDADSYEEMEIGGLLYENFIYKGHKVTINAYDMFHDPDENGLIIPLNQAIVQDTPLVELTDLSYQCMHIVFNSYKVVKKKWYQTGIFAVILVIVAIVIIVVTWGAGTPAAATMIATALGGTMLAIVAAATIYVVGMMVLLNMLTKVAVEVFGAKWGPIIAMVAMLVAMNWGSISGVAAGTQSASSLITAQSVMQASTTMLNAYSHYASFRLSEIQKEMLGLQTEFEREMAEIERLTQANLGTHLDMIDVQGYTEATLAQLWEPAGQFLQRTLLTGSDVADITNGMVSNFTEVGLQLPTIG